MMQVDFGKYSSSLADHTTAAGLQTAQCAGTGAITDPDSITMLCTLYENHLKALESAFPQSVPITAAIDPSEYSTASAAYSAAKTTYDSGCGESATASGADATAML